MSKKQNKVLNDNKLRELKVSDSLTNLEEFTRILTDEIDFNCFDVLSVTRLDTETPYTKKFAHAHMQGHTYTLSDQETEIPSLSIVKKKLN